MREPQTTRAKVSRPRSSVPNGCASVGALRISFQSVCRGSTLAIHGVTAHGERYRRLAQEAFPERRWLAVDLRGHGRSTWDAPWTVERHVADLLETLDAEGAERVVVIGHSYGGMIGLHLLATAPERVSRLALLDPAIELPGGWMPGYADDIIEDAGWATPAEALAKRLEGRSPQSLADATEDVQRHVYLAPDGRYRMRFCRGAAVAGWSEMARTTVSVAHASRPCLLVVAKQEQIVRPELRAAVLITRKVSRTAVGASARETLTQAGLPVLDAELGQRVTYQEAPAAGQGVSRLSGGRYGLNWIRRGTPKRARIPSLWRARNSCR
jgi:lipase